MAALEFRINSAIRHLLTHHWIDLHEIRWLTFRGTVRFAGRLRHVGDRPFETSSESFLDVLELETRAIPGVRYVYFDLSNYVRDDHGQWICLDEADGEDDPAQSAATRPNVYELPGGLDAGQGPDAIPP